MVDPTKNKPDVLFYEHVHTKESSFASPPPDKGEVKQLPNPVSLWFQSAQNGLGIVSALETRGHPKDRAQIDKIKDDLRKEFPLEERFKLRSEGRTWLRESILPTFIQNSLQRTRIGLLNRAAERELNKEDKNIGDNLQEKVSLEFEFTGDKRRQVVTYLVIPIEQREDFEEWTKSKSFELDEPPKQVAGTLVYPSKQSFNIRSSDLQENATIVGGILDAIKQFGNLSQIESQSTIER